MATSIIEKDVVHGELVEMGCNRLRIVCSGGLLLSALLNLLAMLMKS
jgi:hypothetical protein